MAKRNDIPADAWQNVNVTDLHSEAQALVTKFRDLGKAQQAAREALEARLIADARAAGHLAPGKAYKFSYYYLNRDETLGFAEIDAPKAKGETRVERKVASVNPFAASASTLLGPDKKPKASGGAASLKCQPAKAKA